MSANPYEPNAEPDLLESWKEIAAYLGKSVRAVQEWEKHEGLPVHRHQHEKRGTIYAYRSEIAAWLESRASQNAEPVEAPVREFPVVAPVVIPQRPRRVVIALAAICLTIAGIAVIRWMPVSKPAQPVKPLAYQQRVWALVIPFENQTGESRFDDVIGYAVERELTESRLVRVASRQRVEDTLRLMKRPVDVKLNDALAREIAERDNAIRFVIGGRIEKASPAYVLSARIIDPLDGSVIETTSVDSRSADEVPSAVRLLSSRVRELLGESKTNIDSTTRALEKVTTPSLTALRLYSKSVELGNRDQWLGALDLAKRAVDEDPQFASAYIWLAWAMTNTGQSDYLKVAQRAVELAKNASDRERYWILASYYTMRNEPETAVANFEALLTLQPDHYWALSGVVFHDNRVGKPSLANRYAIEAVDVRPNDAELNALAGWSLAAAGKTEQAASYVRRALALARQQEKVPVNGALFWAYFFEPYAQWLRRDFRGSGVALDRVVQNPAVLTSEARDAALKLAVVHYLTLGNIDGARENAARIGDQNERHLMLALSWYSAGNVAALREELRRIESTEDAPLAVWMLARIGEIQRGEKVAKQFSTRRQFQFEEVNRSMKAELAVARGRASEAIDLLAGVDKIDGGPFHRESQTLAKAWLLRGNREEAIRVLRSSWERMPSTATRVTSAMFWMWSGRDLAQIYRTMHRDAEAVEIEKRLATLVPHDRPIIEAERVAER